MAGTTTVVLKHFLTNTTRFEIKTKQLLDPSDRIAVEFLSRDLEKLGSITIGHEGLKFEMNCSGEDKIEDQYHDGIIESGIWSFMQNSTMMTVLFNGEYFYMFDIYDGCVTSEIKAVQFNEKTDGASQFYKGINVTGKQEKPH